MYAHPVLEPVLARTLGIPVFQEQLIQMATVLGDCTADEADLLRRAMGSKRGLEKIERIRDKLYSGMARHAHQGRRSHLCADPGVLERWPQQSHSLS